MTIVLRNTIRNIAAVAILIAAAVAPTSGVAAVQVSDQPPQDVRATAIGGGKIYVSWLDPLKEAGSTTDYRYKVQWKSGSLDYSESRQAISTGSEGYKARSTLRKDLFYRITGLETGVEYTVRVMRVTDDGDSEPSNEAKAIPATSLDILRMTVEALVARYGEDSPWIQQTWQYLEDNNVLISVGEIGSGNSGSFKDRCSSPDPMSGLNVCTTDFVEFDDPTSEHVVVHELAHVYSIDNYVLDDHPDKATGIAIALIYLDTLQQLDPAWLCNKYEFLADLMTIRSMGDLATPGYWGECETTPHTDKALEIVNSALAGNTPEWFDETYSISGTPNLEQLWTDIQEFKRRRLNLHEEAQTTVVYHLRNAFGGYCDNANATASMFGDGPTRNPWRDGGCVPAAPEIELASDEDGYLSISWTVPGDDGGTPIEGYKVRWRSGGQQYDGSRQVTIRGPSTLSRRLGGLVQGIRHHVQVLAYNTNGDGTPSDEAATVINGNQPPSPPSTETSPRRVTGNTRADTGRPGYMTGCRPWCYRVP